MNDLIISTIAQGLLWSVLAIGVYLTFRTLHIADLSVEGTYPLGAAVAAVLLEGQYSPATAVLTAGIAGMLAGAATGLLHTKLKIPALLAGILTMIALYSVNLRVMGKANISLLNTDTVYTALALHMTPNMTIFVVGLIVAVVCPTILYLFFGTEIGLALRATGNNPQMIRAMGVNTDNMILLGLVISNGVVAIAGAFIAQSNGFADVGMGVGTIVIGLASVIIGEVLFGSRSVKNSLISVVLGSIVYRIVIAVVLYLGMPPNDLKLFTALLVAIALALPLVKTKWDSRKAGI
ncbi:ABC transporter permease|uniref:Putative ABC transport system permease protein n=1 Tax=Dendrosporobacter quercicolus TaxID=146817 RepID=A0A1G9TSB9_9FIRM|nr:ABC transporter permease [Dendrosporobacter quercicolus]NSL48867.1 ABC transporter permease [Dendrosporobacter quercicolus DSM 1736]SDM50620.1 putative ABC transport system permease protein [Dendrosporobacter quercicolus]